MRIVCWNMQAGFGTSARRLDRAWHYLHALDPDIALLQETVPPDWARYEWRIFHAPVYTTKPWGSAVVVKKDILASEHRLEDDHRWLRQYHGAAILATIDIDGHALTAASIYAPAYEVKSEDLEGVDRSGVTHGGIDSVWPLYLIFHDLFQLLPGRRFVAGGDFNASRMMDDLPGFVGGNRDFFQSVEEAGFHNCLSKFHQGKEVQTFFQEGKNPHQLDHLYSDGDLHGKLASCGVVEHPVTMLNLSDHAPIIANFEG